MPSRWKRNIQYSWKSSYSLLGGLWSLLWADFLSSGSWKTPVRWACFNQRWSRAVGLPVLALLLPMMAIHQMIYRCRPMKRGWNVQWIVVESSGQLALNSLMKCSYGNAQCQPGRLRVASNLLIKRRLMNSQFRGDEAWKRGSVFH